MPCTAPSRNNLGVQGPCGFPTLTSVAGVDVSAASLCSPHWQLKNGALPGLDSSTVLLIHCDGTLGSTGFSDSSSARRPVTALGDAKIDTAQSKFGGGSVRLDSIGDTISVPDAPELNFGSGDFTIDFWFRPNSVTGFHWVAAKSSIPQGGSWALGVSDTVLYAYISSQITSWDIANAQGIATALAIGTWCHVALVRQGNTFRTFKDGVLYNTWTSALPVYLGNDPVVFGAQTPGGGGMDCWMDEIRISRAARWASGFSVPTGPYT